MRSCLFVVCLFFFSALFTSPALALDDPLSIPNNKFGIHILFPAELSKAARLINSSGGDWGYVTIPIQSGDKNTEKWQEFMDEAKKNHVIPLLRLATENWYFNTNVWRKPDDYDTIDFANFLNSLDWPTKNRYIIAYNEVNRGDEWGGTPDPAGYAQTLSYIADTFKSRNSDFFIISSGFDNASGNLNNAIDEYDFMRGMAEEIPDIFSKIDGLASHSYPNPGFSQPPSKQGAQSIATFKFERALAQKLSGKKLPVFITETGWSTAVISEDQAADYYKQAFTGVWNDDGIVAVTPFLFQAGSPFDIFSFITTSGSPSEQYKAVESLPKQRGLPNIVHTTTLSALPIPKFPFDKSVFGSTIQVGTPIKSFTVDTKPAQDREVRRIIIATFLQWFLKF